MEKWLVVDLEDGAAEEFDSKQEAIELVKEWSTDGNDMSEVKVYKVSEVYAAETSVELVREK
ncbi:MAG: hypothetical protein NUV78_03035 [Candidatus Zambryskibacteria bacterium]|nr:hypothetical protein [Candidatus Zambryskibacteria bacterium]